MTHASLGRAPIETPRHGRLRTSSPAGTVLKFLGVAVTVVLVALVTTAGIAFANLNSQVQANAVDISGGQEAPAPPPLLGAFPGGFNLLVVGTDNDPNQGDDFGERDATLNDVNILLHVSADHKNAVVVSFPRDLVIPHPECTDPTNGDVYDSMSARPSRKWTPLATVPSRFNQTEVVPVIEVSSADTITIVGISAADSAAGSLTGVAGDETALRGWTTAVFGAKASALAFFAV